MDDGLYCKEHALAEMKKKKAAKSEQRPNIASGTDDEKAQAIMKYVFKCRFCSCY